MNKPVRYEEADMNHQAAIEKAGRKDLPVPCEFKGRLHDYLKRDDSGADMRTGSGGRRGNSRR
jgi:hypothetical protein